MKNPSDNLRVERGSWSQIIAFAWLHPNVLKELRKDPKNTIMKLAGKASPPYEDVDDQTKSAAGDIMYNAENDVSEGYRGYLPIPDSFEALENLGVDKLEQFLEHGITGILKFDQNANLWAEELDAAWTDRAKLIKIRQDPLKNLMHAEELSNSEFGIFPLPDRPSRLEKLNIEDLKGFIGENETDHLGGIFLIGS